MCEELAVDFIKLPPRALPSDWIAVADADVAEMLRQARVREPWHAPELGCYSLAQCINNPLGYRSVHSVGKTTSKKRPRHDRGVDLARTKTARAQNAIDELLRALPKVFAEFESSVAQSFRVYSSSPLRAERMRDPRPSPGHRKVRDSQASPRSLELGIIAMRTPSSPTPFVAVGTNALETQTNYFLNHWLPSLRGTTLEKKRAQLPNEQPSDPSRPST